MQVRHPLAGYPSTMERSDDHGLPAYEIEPRELTPEGAIKRAQLLGTLKAVLALWSVYEWYNHAWAWSALIIMAIVSAILYRIALRFLNAYFWQKTKLVLTCQFVSIRRTGQDWEHFRYPEVSGFTLRSHDDARDEQLQLEYDAQRASQRQTALRKRVYYGDSFHISVVQLGQQVDLFTIYGQKNARAVVERLQLCYRILGEVQAPSGKGVVYNDLGHHRDI
jgi:hypothetical protein